MYKCVYDAMKNKCNATASAIYTTYHVIMWSRWLATIDCDVSEYMSVHCSASVCFFIVSFSAYAFLSFYVRRLALNFLRTIAPRTC